MVGLRGGWDLPVIGKHLMIDHRTPEGRQVRQRQKMRMLINLPSRCRQLAMGNLGGGRHGLPGWKRH